MVVIAAIAKSKNVLGSGTAVIDPGARGPPGNGLMTILAPIPRVTVLATMELDVNSHCQTQPKQWHSGC